MSPLNRREFLLNGAAVSAAAVLAPHLSAMSSEGAQQSGNTVSQETCTVPAVQPQFRRETNFVNWREQGLYLGERAVRNQQCFR